MTLRDLLALSGGSLLAHRLRSALSLLGVGIGIAAVTLLTTVGEGTREFVLSEFTQFGANILSIHPGKTETSGLPGVVGGTTQKLTVDDAAAVARVPGVLRVNPMLVGQAAVAAGGRSRSVFVYGTGPALPEMWGSRVRQGTFLPAGDLHRGVQATVLGAGLAEELFPGEPALGKFVRIAGSRLRVIGVMAPRGQVLGFDMDDTAFLPIATALRLFGVEELDEMQVTFTPGFEAEVVARVRALLTDRHRGREDFTITSQAAMLEVFGNVMRMITFGLAGLGGISLLVGAVGILTTMWIAVGERTAEIGLLRALGATSGQVLALFLAESAVLSFAGGLAGVSAGLGLAWLLRLVLPGLPLETPLVYVAIAAGVSVVVGLLSGVLPARRAATLDPIEALRAE